MGLSGGGKTTSGSAQKWAQPYATAAAGTAASVFNANQPANAAITKTITDLLPSIQAKYQQGNPALNAAQGYVKSTLSPSFMAQSNPYLANMIASTNRDVTNQVGAAYGSRGSYGGTAWAGNLARTLADSENSLRYGDYTARMQQQQQAAGLAPQMAAADYLAINPMLQTATTAAALPYTGLEAYTGALGTLFNGSKQTAPGIGRFLLGNAASGAASAMSGGA